MLITFIIIALQNPLTPMTDIRCFLPVENADARILILGSMPGKASLDAAQYYAHPRNAFWPIMGELTGAGPNLPYESRIRILKSHGYALWDVLASCQRSGSLDSEIRSEQPNDFASFFRSHTKITLVCFNGATAETYYRKRVLPTLSASPVQYLRLPSTSPAHASLSCEQKLRLWQAINPTQAG